MGIVESLSSDRDPYFCRILILAIDEEQLTSDAIMITSVENIVPKTWKENKGKKSITANYLNMFQYNYNVIHAQELIHALLYSI